MTPPRIYLSPPHMSGMEQQFVQETFVSNWIAVPVLGLVALGVRLNLGVPILFR